MSSEVNPFINHLKAVEARVAKWPKWKFIQCHLAIDVKHKTYNRNGLGQPVWNDYEAAYKEAEEAYEDLQRRVNEV